MSHKEVCHKLAESSRRMHKCHGSLAEHHRNLAKSAEQRADFASAKVHRAIADEHEAIAAAHGEHVGHFGELAAHSVRNPNVIEGNGLSRVAKGADDPIEHFFAKYFGETDDQPLGPIVAARKIFG